jgi:transcriptional regulator with XRE-family HTH domain
VVPSRQARHPLSADQEAALRLLGATIRQYRKQRRVSLQRLATLTGLHHSYISEIERGQRNVTVLSLRSIAAALQLPVSLLLQGWDASAVPVPPPQE